MQKKKAGIFSKKADIQTKKEKMSSQREATEIQSTQARNEYLMALAGTNAHLSHFFQQDIPNLIKTLDDDVLDKCRNYLLNILSVEIKSGAELNSGVARANGLTEGTSADWTNYAFLMEPASSCIR